jgi:hypothetical protein
MNSLREIVPILLYVAVGIVSLAMARKNILSRRFLQFHEKASGRSWDSVEPGLQYVIIALTRASGLGFLVIGLLLVGIPVIHSFFPNPFLGYGVPLISLLYCVGLARINYELMIKTNASTPWKQSLYAGALILIGTIVSFVQ